MRLSERDRKLFLKLHLALLFYANQQTEAVEHVSTPGEFICSSVETKITIRDALCENAHLIDSFVAENPVHFSAGELNILRDWKHFIKGRFFLIRYLKKYAVFLEEGQPRAYGVVGLSDEIEDMLGPRLPIYIEIVLLPFRGQIVYDGLVTTYSVYFGPGMRQSLNDTYQEAKFRYGVITSLPFSPDKAEISDDDRLKFYLKSKGNRERYWEEIENLVNKDSSLLILYHQEKGKIDARALKKRLRKMDIKKAWFAVLEGMIIASGPTKDGVKRILEDILPSEKQELAYIFQLRGR